MTPVGWHPERPFLRALIPVSDPFRIHFLLPSDNNRTGIFLPYPCFDPSRHVFPLCTPHDPFRFSSSEWFKLTCECSAMGKSRSATMILAYLLSPFSPSHSPALTPETALSILRSVRPMAEPNPGFMSQLALYHTMGYPPDPALHPLYQRWLFARDVEESIASGRVPEEIRFEDELSTAHDQRYGVEGDGQDSPVTSSEPGAVAAYETDAMAASAELTEYRCRHCRTLLTSTPYLVSHTSPPSTSDPNEAETIDPSWPPTHPSYKPSFPASPPSLEGCAHVHTHPLSWMRPELTEGKLEGRLDCPGRRF